MVFQVRFIIQMIAAALIFMGPLNKRSHFLLRAAGSACVLVAGAALLSLAPMPEGQVGEILYWSALDIVTMFMVWFCADCRPHEAFFITIGSLAMQHGSYNIMMIIDQYYPQGLWLKVAVLVGFYLLTGYFIVRRMPVNGTYPVGKDDIIPAFTVVMIVQVISVLMRPIAANIPRFGMTLYLICESTCCVYILAGQAAVSDKMRVMHEADGVRHLMALQKAQFQVSQSTIDTINRKCHDLKHQIRALYRSEDEAQRSDYLQEIGQSLKIYDAAIQTGNAALDIVLMEKNLYCQSHEIQFTCMAEGADLHFMKDADVYSLFGNAIDNAIEAVLQLDDPEKRVIAVKVFSQGELVMIQVQNYYAGTLQFENGLPVTTHQDKDTHGFGMMSIRYTAEKYKGTLQVTADHGIFSLQILLPMSENHAVPGNT